MKRHGCIMPTLGAMWGRPEQPLERRVVQRIRQEVPHIATHRDHAVHGRSFLRVKSSMVVLLTAVKS
jgi:hypothetical protein